MTEYIIKETTSSAVSDLKRLYLEELSAPLDGMWESFAGLADHYAIHYENQIMGYCVINDEKKILQFFITEPSHAAAAFDQVLAHTGAIGAIVHTSDSHGLCRCLDHQKSIAVNGLLYHEDKKNTPGVFGADCHFRPVSSEELQEAVIFGEKALGADRNWLENYFSERIKRQELFGLWQGSGLIATGECRLSDSQHPYADVGMVVSQDHRGKGLATTILQHFRRQCHEKGLRAICSTESDNIAARKAIAKAGFASNHRILQVTF